MGWDNNWIRRFENNSNASGVDPPCITTVGGSCPLCVTWFLPHHNLVILWFSIFALSKHGGPNVVVKCRTLPMGKAESFDSSSAPQWHSFCNITRGPQIKPVSAVSFPLACSTNMKFKWQYFVSLVILKTITFQSLKKQNLIKCIFKKIFRTNWRQLGHT